MLCLARLMRWAIVASGTRKALAISAVVKPPTARSVSAIAKDALSTGWQHMNSRINVSSGSISASISSTGSIAGSSSAVIAVSRWRHAISLRAMSTIRLDATRTASRAGFREPPPLATAGRLAASLPAPHLRRMQSHGNGAQRLRAPATRIHAAGAPMRGPTELCSQLPSQYLFGRRGHDGAHLDRHAECHRLVSPHL